LSYSKHIKINLNIFNLSKYIIQINILILSKRKQSKSLYAAEKYNWIRAGLSFCTVSQQRKFMKITLERQLTMEWDDCRILKHVCTYIN